MIRSKFLFALALALSAITLMFLSHSARACSCMIIEPDMAYNQAFIVFLGTVEKITEPPRQTLPGGITVMGPDGPVTRLKVEQYFKGTGDAEIELHGGNTTCDIRFEVGKQYVVYATRNEQTGTLGAFTCSRTRLLDNFAKADISYLRRIVRGGRPTMFYGYVFRSRPEVGFGDPDRVGDLSVTVEGEGKRYELKTDAGGYFEVYDLAAGSYRVRTGLTGKLRGAEEKTIEVASGAVVSYIFRTTPMGGLLGRVVDREGKPIAEITVEIWDAKTGPVAGRQFNYVSTDQDGKFVFNEVIAGRYILAVNSTGRRSLYAAPFLPSYYPNAQSSAEAQVITIADGVVVEAGDFILQERFPTVAISGVVVTADGKPVSGAYVYLDKNGGDWDSARSVQTDGDGRFVHQAFEGVKYILRAGADAPGGGSLESNRLEVTAAKAAAPVRLVVQPPK